jgi:hypothetical protein
MMLIGQLALIKHGRSLYLNKSTVKRIFIDDINKLFIVVAFDDGEFFVTDGSIWGWISALDISFHLTMSP